MFRLARRSVVAHKLRLILTAVAIILGVAFVSGTYVFTDTITRSFDELFTNVNQNVDFYVRGTSEFGTSGASVPETVVEELRQISGVERVVPSIEGIAQLVDADGEPIGGSGPPTLGFSYLPEASGLTPVTLREGNGGRFPAATGEVVIDSFAADANELVVGDSIDIILPVGTEEFEIVGIVTFGDADNLLGATLAIFDFGTAQRVFEFHGEVSSISILSESGADQALVQAQIADVLPEQVEVVTSQQQTEDDTDEFSEGLGFINTILLVIAGVAVFVGAFIIQNTFRIIVAQRTRELAMLRAVGATGRQVMVMVAIEALIVGVVASAVGIAAGVLIASGLKAAFSAFGFGIPAGGIVILGRTVIVGLVVGVVVTVFSALLPARKAARVPPVAAMREVVHSSRALGRRITTGVVVSLIGVALVLLGLFVDIDNAISVVGFGALIAFIGVSVLAPLVARAFARTFGRPLPRFFGVVGRLAQENAMRRPRRTAATASALMIGVALVSVIAVFSASAKAGVAAVFEDDFTTDLQVRLGGFVDPRITGLSPAISDDLRELDELEVVSRMRIGEYRTRADGPVEFLLGVDGALDRVTSLEMVSGSYGDMGPGTALLLDTEAAELGVERGDSFMIQVPSGEEIELEVAGIFESDALGVPLMVPLQTYEEHLEFRLDRFVLILKADGVTEAEARAAVDVVAADFPNVEVTNTEELISDIEAQIDSLLNLLVVLLGFAIIIALLGIVNTLVLSVSERRREIGLLRAVGMERRQVKRMIRWESVLIAVFGGMLGLVVGVLLGMAVVVAVGEGLKLSIPARQLVFYLVAAALGGVLAAIAPARRGAKTNVLEAISYE